MDKNARKIAEVFVDLRRRVVASAVSGFVWFVFLVVWIAAYWNDFSASTNWLVVLLSAFALTLINGLIWIQFGRKMRRRWEEFRKQLDRR